MNEYKESQSSLYSPLSHFFSPLPPSQSKVSRHFMDLQLLPDVLNQFICQSQFEIYKNVYLYTIQTFGTHIYLYIYTVHMCRKFDVEAMRSEKKICLDTKI